MPVMSVNTLNVFTGPDSVKNYFDPDQGPPLPLVEVPECLNPYRQDGVRIYAKMMTMHPANNVKCMPGMLYPSVSELSLRLPTDIIHLISIESS